MCDYFFPDQSKREKEHLFKEDEDKFKEIKMRGVLLIFAGLIGGYWKNSEKLLCWIFFFSKIDNL